MNLPIAMNTQQTATVDAVRSSLGQPFLTLENVVKVYNTRTGPQTIIKEINLEVQQGEFICVIGHSGCGKSTMLNTVSGFVTPTEGEVKLKGKLVEKPGPDRMMVFQNYALLPWLTAFENVYLAIDSVFPQKSHSDKSQIVNEHLAMVGLAEAAQKKPPQLSGGMRQRVAIARALSLRPEVLVLDEPFGALDAITKEELQEELAKICLDHGCTVLMVTHDIDEALFLADRLVMMTNGPEATIGEILEVPFAHPRDRAKIRNSPEYYQLRNHALNFLDSNFESEE